MLANKEKKYHLKLCENSSFPLESRIASYFRKKIYNGELKHGDVLPRSKSIRGVSHVSVIAAYKLLAKEGLVKSVRSKGTIVISDLSRTSYGILLLSSAGLYPILFMHAFYEAGKYRENLPQVFFIDSEQGKKDSDISIDLKLRDAVESGTLRGIFTLHEAHFKKHTEWLQDCGIPVVSGFHGGQNNVIVTDYNKLVEKSIDILIKKECKKIYIYSGVYNIFPEILEKNVLRKYPDLNVDLIINNSDLTENYNSAVNSGKKLVRQMFHTGDIKPENGIIFIDDFVAAAALMELKELGLPISERIKMLVITHKSQMNELLSEIDQLLISPIEAVKEIVNLFEEIIKNQDDSKSPFVKYISHSTIRPAVVRET